MPNGRPKGRRRRGGKPRAPKAERKIRSGYQLYPQPLKMPLGTAIRLQLRNIITVTSSAGGIINGVIPCDPSATLAAPFPAAALFVEWSSWAALFAQVKCVQLECTFRSCYVETKGDTITNVAISGNLQTASAPGSYTAVIDNADSQTWPCTLDTAGQGRYHAIKHRKSLQWASTGTPVPSASNYVGCPGGIGMYASSMPVSTQMFDILVVGTYLVSSRT